EGATSFAIWNPAEEGSSGVYRPGDFYRLGSRVINARHQKIRPLSPGTYITSCGTSGSGNEEFLDDRTWEQIVPITLMSRIPETIAFKSEVARIYCFEKQSRVLYEAKRV